MAGVIRRPDGFCTYDDKGQRIGGPFATEEEANSHLAQHVAANALPKKKGQRP
jgi:hypothetical protein